MFVPPPGSIKAVTVMVRAVLPWWEKRQKLEVFEADIATAVAKYQLDHRRMSEAMAQDQERLRAAWYPLGFPGRIRELLADVNPLVPRLLVPALSEVTGSPILTKMEEQLGLLDARGGLFHLVTDAVVESGTRQPFRGVVVREVALAEFDPSPSIIVLAQMDGDVIQLVAHTSNFFSSVDGQNYLQLPLSRLSAGLVEVAWIYNEEGGLEQDWRVVSDVGINPTEVFTSSACTMLIGLLCAYWATQGVHWRLNSHSDDSLKTLLSAPGVCAAEPVDSARTNRVIREVQLLEAAGHAVTPFPSEDRDLALLVQHPLVAAEPTMIFEMKGDYPAEPPTVWIDDRQAMEQLIIPPSQWSSDRSLLEILNGVIGRGS